MSANEIAESGQQWILVATGLFVWFIWTFVLTWRELAVPVAIGLQRSLRDANERIQKFIDARRGLKT